MTKGNCSNYIEKISEFYQRIREKGMDVFRATLESTMWDGPVPIPSNYDITFLLRECPREVNRGKGNVILTKEDYKLLQGYKKRFEDEDSKWTPLPDLPFNKGKLYPLIPIDEIKSGELKVYPLREINFNCDTKHIATKALEKLASDGIVVTHTSDKHICSKFLNRLGKKNLLNESLQTGFY